MLAFDQPFDSTPTTVVLRVRLPRRPAGRVALRLVVTATDAAGNRTRRSRTVRLRR